MITTLLLYKILQLFVIMLIGFILAKLKVVKNSDSTALAKVSLYLMTPAAIINAFDFDMTANVTKGLILSFAAAFIIHTIFLLLDKVYIKAFGDKSVERASVMYSNAGNLIIPLVTFVLGEEWVIYSTAYISVQLLFLWTHGIRLFSSEKKLNIKKIILNINIIAIFIGLAITVSGIRLPSFAKGIVSSFADMLGPVAMLIAGIIAADIDFKNVFKNKRLYLVMLIRMIIYPLIIMAAIKAISLVVLIPDIDKILLIPYLASITPSAATVMQFAQIHNKEADFAASVNIMTTVVCIATMPLLVALYNTI